MNILEKLGLRPLTLAVLFALRRAAASRAANSSSTC